MNHRDNNIGTLRFLGAFLVLFGHSFNLSDTTQPADPLSQHISGWMPWQQPAQTLGVILFFAISGYLVTRSYLNRQNVFYFLLARCLRIYPALIVAVTFCVCVVGWYHTTLPTAEYFHHPVTIQYWWVNASLRSVRFILPSVFGNNPVALSVNGSLWTLPVEFRLYLVVALLGVAGLLQRAKWLTLVVILGVAEFIFFPGRFPILLSPDKPYLLVSFVMGMLFCAYQPRLHPNLPMLIALVIASVLLRITHHAFSFNFIGLLAFVALVLWIGFHPRWRLPALDRYGDLSYGLYLYAFPVQQTVVGWIGTGKPWLLLAISLLLATVLALISWHLIEAPAQRWGQRLMARTK